MKTQAPANANHTRVQLDREVERLERLERRDEAHRHRRRPAGEQQRQHAGNRGKRQAFGRGLPDQAPPAGADGQTDEELAAPRFRAREHQVGEVGAGHDEHQGGNDGEERQRRRELCAHGTVACRAGNETERLGAIARDFGLVCTQSRRFFGEEHLARHARRTLGALDAGTVGEAADDLEPSRFRSRALIKARRARHSRHQRRLHRQRDPHVGGMADGEPGES